MYGDVREKLLEILALVIILSPISSIWRWTEIGAKVLCSVVQCVAVCCSALNVCCVTHSVFADRNRGESAERGETANLFFVWVCSGWCTFDVYICLLE